MLPQKNKLFLFIPQKQPHKKLYMDQGQSSNKLSELAALQPVNAIIIASDEDVCLLKKTQFNLRICHTYIEKFQNQVCDYLPFLKANVITESSLLKFCVRMRKCTSYFTSAVFMLKQQLKNCGLKFPQGLDEINSLITSFHKDPKRLTIFFQVVRHFFSPESPYLQENGSTAQFQKANPWKNIGNVQYNLQQMCHIIEGLHIEYTVLKGNLQVFIFIFSQIIPIFHCKQEYILYPIVEAFKDIHCEIIGLETYLRAIGKSTTYFKSKLQNLKNNQKHQKVTQRKQSENPRKEKQEGGKEAKQVVPQKATASQSASKPLYLTIKEKVFGLMRIFFGGPASLFKRQQQQPQQQQRLLQEQ